MYKINKGELVREFNQRVMQVAPRPLGMMDSAEMSFSLKALREEVTEMEEAHDRGDLVGVVDALVDLDFFFRGILYKHGITPQLYDKLFTAVFNSNMAKTLGQPKATRCELALDAVKPEGWVGPEETIRRLLEEYMDSGQ